MRKFVLNNGVSVPCIANGPMILGYGKRHFSSKSFLDRAMRKIFLRPLESSRYVNAISESIKMGYTFIDYSSSYGDGVLIGNAIKRSGVKREELTLTSRISNHYQRTGEIRKCVESQLNSFGTDYLDLLMFHWPVPSKYIETWKEMEKIYEEGLCKAIGIANCNKHHIEKLLSSCKVIPAVNQFEIHPLFTQKELITYCKKERIQVEAYTPIARCDERMMRQPRLQEIAKKYHKTIVQIILKWHIMGGVIPVIRSLDIKHLKSNIDIFDFNLSEEEMLYIDSLNINSRLRFDPDNCDYSIL